MTAITTQLRITRIQLPPVEVPTDETMWGRHDAYAEVSAGSITAEVLRFAYWDDRAGGEFRHDVFGPGRPGPELSYEVRMDGMGDSQGGTCELYATEPALLLDLAAVCGAAAMPLDEARQAGSEVQHA